MALTSASLAKSPASASATAARISWICHSFVATYSRIASAARKDLLRLVAADNWSSRCLIADSNRIVIVVLICVHYHTTKGRLSFGTEQWSGQAGGPAAAVDAEFAAGEGVDVESSLAETGIRAAIFFDCEQAVVAQC